VGRRLSVPLRFIIHPTLAVTTVRFLQLGVPLRDGRRYAPLTLNLRDAGLTRDASLYRNLTASSGRTPGGSTGGLVRNSSEGALLSPTALSRQQTLQQQHHNLQQQQRSWDQQQQRQLWLEVEEQTRLEESRGGGQSSAQHQGTNPGISSVHTIDSSSSSSPTKRAALAAAADADAAAASTASITAETLGQTTDCVLELGVRNCSDRYFRTWLSRLPGKPGAEGAESAVVVLEPGDNVRLLCPLLPTQLAALSISSAAAGGNSSRLSSASSGVAAGGSSGNAATTTSTAAAFQQPPHHHHHHQQQPGSPEHPPAISAHDTPVRMQCAERLVDALGVRWEMITGDVAPDKLPRGLVRLVPVDVAHSLSPGGRLGL